MCIYTHIFTHIYILHIVLYYIYTYFCIFIKNVYWMYYFLSTTTNILILFFINTISLFFHSILNIVLTFPNLNK